MKLIKFSGILLSNRFRDLPTVKFYFVNRSVAQFITYNKKSSARKILIILDDGTLLNAF